MAEPTKKSSAPPQKRDYPEWEQDDAQRLREFLASQTGQRTLAWLKYWAPSLLDGKDVNMTLVASGEVKGFSEAVEYLHFLSKENPVADNHLERTPEYPDLEDDSKWAPEQDIRQ